ncbi:substrate-binding periplasmic protein [Roseospira goensis]|uniref:Polar amino acid transport system substrate-binding protein n=1 Tax=Roseospira goensis TaxID=391922 RepID=A0A7W6S3H1_9PROT|nr:transporter substrate-binding domain-containing protein [Roseospira goensis]MBB4287695.1 polar amino acid transport system substrate-binding protein [Roseospira goensis]
MTSLEWPPYAGESLPNGGFTVVGVRAAFEAMGHHLDVLFMPWPRAIATGLGEGFIGYFPKYYSAEAARTSCAFSDPMPSGPVGFVVPADSSVMWHTLDDLKDKEIGVVAGYVNTVAFDEAVADGRLTVMPANDDLTNVRKVAARRLDMAVIDPHVLEWLLVQHPELRGRVEMHPRLLEDKNIYICFQKTVAGERARRIFNAGLARVDMRALMPIRP